MRFVSIAIFLALAAGCGGAAVTAGARLGDAERARRNLAGREAETLASQAFKHGDEELALARSAKAAGDLKTADLHAERALASYDHAVIIARVARATQDEGSARDALARATALAEQHTSARIAIEREVTDLEKQLKVAREAATPSPSAKADPEREKARAVAAHSLATQAQLLCSAARLVSQDAPGLAAAESAVADLEPHLRTTPAPIDAASRARASCLTSLTKARRVSGHGAADATDALLSELSQASAGSGDPSGPRRPMDLTPARDERGVLVTLRRAWSGDKLAPDAEAALKDLGRVAAAHPTFGVQIVLHDARANAVDTQTNERRGESAKKALTDGGAAAAKIKVEKAGARAPVVDPDDARLRDRNARVEVVFVASGS